MRRHLYKWIDLLFIPGAIAMAQEPPAAPTFHAGVQLVQVSVIAQDKQGKPVAGLSREDFQILDNGSPREIRLFVSKPENSNPAPPEPDAPNTFTNRIDSPSGSHCGYSVILIDSLFTDWGDVGHPGAANARVYALRALRSIPSGDRVGIYATARNLQVICEFTSDRDSLQRQLQRWKPDNVDTVEATKALLAPANSPALASSQVRSAQEAPGTGREQDKPAAQAPRLDALQRARFSNDEMDLLADHLAGVPGRKNLIWLSNRFVIEPRELQKLNGSSVSIYPVNINGVTGRLDPLADMLKDIAAQTGGLAYIMRNDIDVAIREAMDDGYVSYTLGFYRSGDDGTSQAHRLAVRVNRPGVTLRYRTSYQTETRRPASTNGAGSLSQALDQPIDATAIPIRATATRVEDRLNLKAVVDVGSLGLARSQGGWKGTLKIEVRFTAADGSPVGAAASQKLDLNLRQAQQGLGYHNDLKIPPKAVDLKVLFANPDSGKIGTLTIPLFEVAANGAKAK
jgi:VWFA-related protein